MSWELRLAELEKRQRRLEKRLSYALQHLDENNFSNDYIERQQIQENSLKQLGYSLDNVRKARIGEARIENAAISGAKIQKAAIGEAHIQAASIGEAALKEAAVSRAKIADLAVDSGKIRDAAITTAKLQNAAVDSAKIANLAVQTAHIALGAITQALIDRAAVGTAQIADGSITDAKIVELTANKITAGVLEVARLIITGENSIVYEINRQNGTLQSSAATIDGGAITERSITADRVAAGAITAREIASKSITANEIQAQSITGAEIKSDTLNAGHIQAGTITADRLHSEVGASLDLRSNTAILSRVDRDELNSRIEQTESGITQSLQTLRTDLGNVDGVLQEFKRDVLIWQKFSAEGLELGRSDSPFRVVLSNTKMSFQENGAEIACFANNRLYAAESQIKRSLSIEGLIGGSYAFRCNEQGLTLNYKK